MPKKTRQLRKKRRNRRRTHKIGMRRMLMDALHLKKMLGGGDFSGENCDITPLGLEDVEKYDTEPPEVVRELNLVADNTIPTPESGSFNTVVTKKCGITQRDEDKDKVLVYRRSKESVSYDEGIAKFREYHEEMKLQIELAHKGLAPHVYMYGILEDPDFRGGSGKPPPLGLMNPADSPDFRLMNPDDFAGPSHGLMNPADSPDFRLMNPDDSAALGLMNPEEESSRGKHSKPMYVYNFSVMEYKISAFNVAAPLIDLAYSRNKHSIQYTDAIRTLNQIFVSIYKLLDKLAESNYLPYDLKLDNLVLDEDYNTAYLIDCDPRYFFPNDIINSAMSLSKVRDSKRTTIYRLILHYIFSVRTITTLDEYIHTFNNEEFMKRLIKRSILQNDQQQYGKNIGALTDMLDNMATNPKISNTPLGNYHRQQFRQVLWTNALRYGQQLPQLTFGKAMLYLTEKIAEYVPPRVR